MVEDRFVPTLKPTLKGWTRRKTKGVTKDLIKVTTKMVTEEDITCAIQERQKGTKNVLKITQY